MLSDGLYTPPASGERIVIPGSWLPAWSMENSARTVEPSDPVKSTVWRPGVVSVTGPV